MRPDFQCDPTARHGTEHFLQRFRGRAHSLFSLYLPCFVYYAVPAVAISQIKSDGQCLSEKISTLLGHCGANLLHCRSPFYLCLEHVDNLGAYTASRPETGLLISSVCDSLRLLPAAATLSIIGGVKRRSYEERACYCIALFVFAVSRRRSTGVQDE